jgi:hypothetical protein
MSDQRDSKRYRSPSVEERESAAKRSVSNGGRPSFEGPEHTPARSLLVHFGRWVSDDVEVSNPEETERPWYGPDSTGGSILEAIKHLPPWAGDDFDEVLEDVIKSRSRARF